MATTIQVPTLRLNSMSLAPPFARDDWADALSRLPEAAAAPWAQMSTEREQRTATTDMTFPEWSLSLIGQMHEAGVPIGAGTDTPIGFAVPGYSLHNELEMLVRAGLSPIEALRSATLRPAEFFGLENEMGTVDVGRLADLVLLNANPLDDIHNTRTVHAVVTKGQLLTSEALAALIR
jgi:imidazolonepropionase-like amidohydrolase